MRYEEYRNHQKYDIELWRLIYDTYPYLENLDINTLRFRFGDICKNIKFLCGGINDAKSRNIPFSTWWWFQKLEDIKFALHKKGEDVEAHFDNPLIFPNKKVLSYDNQFFFRDLPSTNVFRYTEEKYALDFLEHGVFRLSNARKYIHLDDVARQDNEIARHKYALGKHTKIINRRTGKEIKAFGNVQYSTQLADYFLLCFSSDLDLNLCSEFSSDAIIHIKNFPAFMDKVMFALGKDYLMAEWTCKYQDIYRHSPHVKGDPGQLKDITFAYQREVRLMAVAYNRKVNSVPYITVSLGSLRDIANGYKISNNELLHSL